MKQESKEYTSPPATIACTALLMCNGPEYQSCERDIFAAINDCGLVYDGGLIVDTVSFLHFIQ
jgi:hypothetical protein